MELKNRPFCGGEPEMIGGDDVYHGEPFWYVGCRCLASMKGEETKEAAAENWNRRAVGWYSEQAGGYVTWDDAFEVDEPIAWRKMPELRRGHERSERWTR